jgi:hypothetical protein
MIFLKLLSQDPKNPKNKIFDTDLLEISIALNFFMSALGLAIAIAAYASGL